MEIPTDKIVFWHGLLQLRYNWLQEGFAELKRQNEELKVKLSQKEEGEN